MNATGILAEGRELTEGEIRQAMAGNLCRCTGYTNIVAAVKRAGQLKDARDEEAP
jgi:aerobic-type carbon monoxide dehydrogenase small subunit (CoxS/CutS family)